MYSNALTSTSSSKLSEGKDAFWSVVRGVCILCAVFIHLTTPVRNGQIPLEYWVYRRMISFPVAVFFALAGHFVHLEKCRSRQYLWNKIKRVLVPYLLFSVVYLIRSSFWAAINWKGVLAALFLGTSELHLYFCVYLLQMILLLPVLAYLMGKSKNRTVWLIGIGMLSVGWSYLRSYMNVLPDWLDVLCFPFLGYYALGLYLKGMTENDRAEKLYWIYRWRWMLLGCGAAVMLAEAYGQRLTMQVSLGNYVYSTVLILALFAVKQQRDPQIKGKIMLALAGLGEISFAIYLIHMLPLRAGFLLEDLLPYPLLQIAELLLAVSISVAAVFGIRTLCRNQKWLKTIGF